ncbi:hypothetical protein PENSUB_4418 [Penicillium subrubescens]|uniref:Uncharacterized protein n=1 Tax=Penicillium subrubescens TaxID=1316194 RepID=A0A1Q5UCP9_9EURO|nr:hypothetical protein PENSUB_4418 [Penicillium subrubescens]
MEVENDSFAEEFLDACYDWELSKVQEALATRRPSAENLNEGLANATRQRHTEMVAALFDAGAGFMADFACAREFLSRGADPNRIGPSGKSILVGAIVSSEDTSWIEVLLEYGARLEQEYLFYALRPRVRQKLQKTSFLLAKGLDPNHINTEWGTPLHYAVECGSPGLVRILLDAGADPTVRSTGKSYYGELPLAAAEHIRIPKNKEEIIALLQT